MLVISPIYLSTGVMVSALLAIGGFFALPDTAPVAAESTAELSHHQPNKAATQGPTLLVPSPTAWAQAEPPGKSQMDSNLLILEKVFAENSPTGGELWQSAIYLLQQNEALRQSMMDRYGDVRDVETRQKIRLLLTSFSSEAVTTFAVKLTSASDPSLRKEGFEFLSASGEGTRSTRDLVLRTLSIETDGRVIAQALRALKPADVADDERADISARLRDILKSPYSEVRIGALQSLAQWDRSMDAKELFVTSLLGNDPVLKLGSLSALVETDSDWGEVKPALLSIATNSGEDRTARIVAIEALCKVFLEDTELDLLHQLRRELGIE